MEKLHHLLEEAARRHPGKDLLLTKDERLTYRSLDHFSNRYARLFRKRGVKKGDRVLIWLPNSLTTVVSLFALSKIGALFVIVHQETRMKNLLYIINDCRPTLIITNEGGKELISENGTFPVILPSDIHREIRLMRDDGRHDPKDIRFCDEACLIYTSGSTGRPKGVISTHRSMLFAAQAIQDRLALKDDDTVGCFLPLSFDYGMYQIFLALLSGATLFLGDHYDVRPGWIQLLEKYHISVLPVVPSLLFILNKLGKRKNEPLKRLRLVTNTGEALPQAYREEFNRVFPQADLYMMYGLTECKRVSILDPQHLASKPDSVGKPLAGTSCWVIDDDENPLPPGRIGQLVVRGPHVMKGYWNEPALTAEKFKIWEGERVLYTGDLCLIDREGYIYFHGRKDEMYKRRGYRIMASEIERVATDIGGVEQAAMVGADGEWRLFVTTCLTKEEVFRQLMRLLEPYKLPDEVVPVPEFPLSPNGKVDKHALSKSYQKENMTHARS